MFFSSDLLDARAITELQRSSPPVALKPLTSLRLFPLLSPSLPPFFPRAKTDEKAELPSWPPRRPTPLLPGPVNSPSCRRLHRVPHELRETPPSPCSLPAAGAMSPCAPAATRGVPFFPVARRPVGHAGHATGAATLPCALPFHCLSL